MGRKKDNYDGTKWRHLPSDKTLSKFAGEYKQETNRIKCPSAAWIKTAVRKLDPNNSADSIYHDLFENRQGPEKEKIGSDRNTHPNLFPWEILIFLRAVFRIRDQKKTKGEAYSAAVMEELSNQLKASLEAKTPESYVDIQYLKCSNIRNQLMRKFEVLFRQRLERIYDHFFDPKAEAQVDALALTMERLDIIISEFPKKVETVLLPDKQALQKLYWDLLSERNKLIPPKGRGGGGFDHYQWNPNADTKLVEKMKRQIKSTSRDPSEEQVEEFLKNYKKYLDYAVLPNEKKDAQQFWEEYVKLDYYYFSEYGVEEFEKDIRTELYMFARDTFNDLRNLDDICFSYSYYTPEHAVSSYARSKLADAHRDIQIKLHQAIRLIRTAYAYFYFVKSCPLFSDHEKKKRIEIAGYMVDQIAALAKEYPQVPALDFKDPNSLEPYLAAYQEYAAPIFGDEIPDKTYLLQVFDPNFYEDLEERCYKLWGLTEYLTMESKIVAAIEIEETVQELMIEYIKMKSY